MRESHKCLIKGNNDTWPRAGDLVLIHDDGPRSQWKLGKITGLHAGRDSLIRVATLKTSLGMTTRPRPSRRTATHSADLWRMKLSQGLL